jgi:NAD(P)-dependent dehydrogenase (short-subunit alcohol dehydrogenase family)
VIKPRYLLALGGLAAAGWLIGRGVHGNFSFAGKVVLITGGSRGLGLLIARRLAAEGARLALVARDQAELDRAADELQKIGAEVLTLRCDLLDRAQTEDAVEQAFAHFGTIDVVINNAGIIEVGPLEEMRREDFARAMDLHFWAPFNLLEKIIPRMRAGGGGRIVNISSVGGKIAPPHFAPYSTSKFALTGFSDALRNELVRDHIHVTTVTPGTMRTGSHVQAKFKGNQAAEEAWFNASATWPLISMSAERAARLIVDACRRGQSSLVLSLPARGAIMANALVPSLFGETMKLLNRLLPQAASAGGNE